MTAAYSGGVGGEIGLEPCAFHCPQQRWRGDLPPFLLLLISPLFSRQDLCRWSNRHVQVDTTRSVWPLWLISIRKPLSRIGFFIVVGLLHCRVDCIHGRCGGPTPLLLNVAHQISIVAKTGHIKLGVRRLRGPFTDGTPFTIVFFFPFSAGALNGTIVR